MPYTAIAVMVGGSIVKLVKWRRVPVPFPIPLELGPRTAVHVFAGLMGDLLLFRGLFRSDRTLWLASWVFHVSLLVLICGHLSHFFSPVPRVVSSLQESGFYAGCLATLSLAFLMERKACRDRLWYITRVSDLVGQALVLAACGTGLTMSCLKTADLVQIKAFSTGLVTFRHEPLPTSPLFLVHFAIACTLAAFFPFTRLVHALGWMVSPSRID